MTDKATILAQLGTIRHGVNAEPEPHVSSVAMVNAVAFINAWPTELTLPEICTDPDGAIVFEWVVARYFKLSLSVGESDTAAYAWLKWQGTFSTGHGTLLLNSGSHQVLQAILADLTLAYNEAVDIGLDFGKSE